MVTNSSYRLIMGKEQIDFFLSNLGYMDFFHTEMFIELFSTFYTTFVQISEFDWLWVLQKGSIFIKMFKNLLINHKGYEAETCHTCL